LIHELAQPYSCFDHWFMIGGTLIDSSNLQMLTETEQDRMRQSLIQ